MTDEAANQLPLQNFDQEFDLKQLLKGLNSPKLEEALCGLFAAPFAVVTLDGEVLLGEKSAAPSLRRPLRCEMEEIGYLECVSDNEGLADAAAALVEQLLRSSFRYLMASTLHLQAVNDDYEQLQKKHEALVVSQLRYKELAENLEQRVKEQVSVIEKTQLQLYQAEKMASVGQLAAGVAHEVNNPIGFIQSNLVTAQSYVHELAELVVLIESGVELRELKQRLVAKDMDYLLDDFKVLLDESLEGAKRIGAIVQDLKGVSNVDGPAESLVDINQLIKSVCNVSLPELARQSKLKLNLKPLPKTTCQQERISQMFLNILRNAAKAIEHKGEILVQSQVEHGHIVVHIADTGKGIAKENLQRIFEPFFTTAEVGGGTGLGLAVSRDVAKAHGGDISVASTPGKGSCFTVSLPIKL